ncbi:MAG TPA: SRPBCC domain-containing protein [Casimicrobiaceae bacterium]
MSSAALRLTRRYAAPPARVFDAWLDPAIAGEWLFATASRPLAHVEIDAQVAGSFCLVDRRDPAERTRYTGEYIEIVRPRRLVFTLSTTRHPQVNTRVTVEVAPLPKGCKLTVFHENVPCEDAEHMEGRWTGTLYGLGATLDSIATYHHRE